MGFHIQQSFDQRSRHSFCFLRHSVTVPVVRMLVRICGAVALWCLVLSSVSLVSSSLAENDNEVDALLKIAREYRDGTDGVARSALRAARFYEFLIERTVGNHNELDPLGRSQLAAEYELASLLEQDPTLSSRYSYLGLMIRAASGGHPDAQHRLSVAYATGIAARDIVPMDAGRSLYLEYMSALSGHAMGNMGMGYRYFQGVGVSESCESALPHYEFAANQAAEHVHTLGLHTPQPDTLKLSEANDPSVKRTQREGSQELIDYYAHLAEQGDALAALTLGNMLMMGTRSAPANETKALYYLDMAAEAKNPAGAGLQGYVLLLQHLRQARVELRKDPMGGKRFSQSGAADYLVSKVLRLLRFSSKKGDVNGVLGLGLAYFHGVGVPVNVSKALEHMQRAVGAHIDAGFYIGEILMGLAPLDLSNTYQAPMEHRVVHTGVATDGIAKGRNSGEVRALESHQIGLAVQKKEIDPAAAGRAYTVSAQMGHLLAQHRLAHMYKRGLTGPASCKETVRLFKMVAEKGPWMEQLSTAHKMYAEGNELAALHLFAQLAAVGVESAQYNAAYILSKCTRCPPVDKSSSLLGGTSMSATTENPFVSDPLERQHRSNKHSAATDFRKLLKDHEAQEKLARSAAKSSGAVDTLAAETSAVSSVAYLPTDAWRDFLRMYHPDSLVDAIDLEFQTASKVVDSVAREAAEAQRMVLCERRALTLFDLSAQQGNSEAYIQLGDFYYYQRAGLLQAERKKEAAQFYQKAADLHHTQAIFNLGIMHEVGDGVSQDFHLAKRYFDQAAQVDNKAKIPRDIALVLLEGHKTIHAVFGPDAASQLLKVNIHLPVSWNTLTFRSYTVWELLEETMMLERRLRRRIDHIVLWYYEHVLQPFRDMLSVLSTPLRAPLRIHRWEGSDTAATGASGADGSNHRAGSPTSTRENALNVRIEHSLQGYWTLLCAAPGIIKALYDKLFDVVYLLLHYLIQGKPHPALTGQHFNHYEVIQLREELLLVILLCIVFCAVLSFKMLRRRLNAALRQQRLQQG